MKVLVRTRQPTLKQEKYFGPNAWRPFAVFLEIFDEFDLKEKLELMLKGKKIKHTIRFMKIENLNDMHNFQYAILEGQCISGKYVDLMLE